MPRIPESELERLKSEVSVEQLARARGVKLQKKGRDLHGRCPFHEDDTPSLVISPEKNLWNCLGACQQGGTSIDWVMKAEGVSFRHAVELLRGDGLPTEVRRVVPVKRSTAKKLPKLAAPDVEDQALLRRVVEYYHQTLKRTPEALEYLRSRGLESAEMVERFQLGFADRTLGYRLPDANRKEGAELRGRLKELGVLRGSGHEHLRGSLVVPLFDLDGGVAQMYGRKTGQRLRKGTALHLYLPGPQRGVFNQEGLQNQEEVILCESILDALTFWCAGLRNVTTTYGTSGLTKDLREAFSRSGTKRVLIAYDRDEAGDAGAERVAEELAGLGLGAYRVQLPKGQDVNEYAQKVKPAGKSLALVVRNAVWLSEGEAPEREVSAPEEGAGGATKEEEEEPPPSSLDAAPAPLPPTDPAPIPEPDPQAEPTPPAPVRRVPPEPEVDELVAQGEEHWLHLGERSYRVRGLRKNLAFEVMKVNVLVRRNGEDLDPLAGAGFHVDTFDLYSARHRQAFVKEAAAELACGEEVLRQELGRLLLALESAQEEEIRKHQEPKAPVAVSLNEDERAEALTFLRSPKLLEEILEDFERVGVVGEETNKLAGYLAAVSRKLERPLAIVVQSNSAAGKSSLMDAVLAFVPEEERVSYSAMTGQSLFYMSGSDLRHKILAIAEEEGAQKASYALKLLQSEGRLTIASTGKDPVTGRLTTEDYQVEGPVMIFLTTTATDVDEELLNRCLVLSVDEGRAQTEAILRAQRRSRTLAGKREKRRRRRILRKHRNAQRLLEPLLVDNPYADQLTFQGHQTRFRRDHEKYLTLIETVALLHQHQRPRKTFEEDGREVAYIEVEPQDIQAANHLAHEVLGRSVDELPPQTRDFLRAVVALVEARCREEQKERSEVRFTRREVREWTGLANSRVHVHLSRLEELEYVLVHAGSRGRSMVYELVYEGSSEEEAPFFPGLLDIGRLGYDANLSASTPDLSALEGGSSGSIRPQFGGNSGPLPGGGESPESLSSSSSPSSLEAESLHSSQNARPGAGARPRRVVPANGTEPPTGAA